MSARLVHLARLVAAGAPYEWTEIAGRTAMRVTYEGASPISVLTEDEARELTQVIANTIEVDVDVDRFICYFDDGDWFWGHSIIVKVLDDGTTDAEFAG